MIRYKDDTGKDSKDLSNLVKDSTVKDSNNTAKASKKLSDTGKELKDSNDIAEESKHLSDTL